MIAFGNLYPVSDVDEIIHEHIKAITKTDLSF